ncbi:hypothetical protein AALO_G00297500 [Alosa alosa]|uniref:Uncharacterized protein n=1 Tax=Alosa alosa TaxID=278164 RepID=A0AAV6FHI9_9TELE|nr:hypothetical protein AALO_G00297500 [Alosa alosa]
MASQHNVADKDFLGSGWFDWKARNTTLEQPQSAGGITVFPCRACLTHRYVLAGTTPRPRQHLSILG